MFVKNMDCGWVGQDTTIQAENQQNGWRVQAKVIGMVVYSTKSLYKDDTNENLSIHIKYSKEEVMEMLLGWTSKLEADVDQITIGHEHGNLNGKCHYQVVIFLTKPINLRVQPFHSQDNNLIFMFQKARNPRALQTYCMKEHDFTHLYPHKCLKKVQVLDKKGNPTNKINPYETIISNLGNLSKEDMRDLIQTHAPKDYFMGQSNISKAIDSLFKKPLPEFEWIWPNWADNLTNQAEISLIKQWFYKWCTPSNLPRRQALVLYGKPCLGKTKFCENLVNHTNYLVRFINRFNKDAMDEKTPKLLILDDMQYPSSDNIECWKQLLTGQTTSIRDCYMNYQWKYEIPCIVLTNRLEIVTRFIKDPNFEGRVDIVEISDYLGPPDTQPIDLTRSNYSLKPETWSQIREKEKKFAEKKNRKQNTRRVVNMNLMKQITRNSREKEILELKKTIRQQEITIRSMRKDIEDLRRSRDFD